MKRILHVTTTGVRLAGAEHLLVGMARNAAALGWECTFVTLDGGEALSRAVALHGAATHRLSAGTMPGNARAFVRLRRLVREIRPDVVHTHLLHGAVAGGLADAPRVAPLVHTRHYSGLVGPSQGPVRRAMDRWAARAADMTIAVSEAAKSHLLQLGVDPRSVEVIENGVDVAMLASAASRSVPLPFAGAPAPFVLACAARQVAAKGIDVLVEALALAAANGSRAAAILLGEGPERARLESLVRARGLSGRVHFAGYVEDAPAWMALASAYVQPSREEGFGLAVVEAMALGVPPIVSDVGGMRDTVVDGESGLRVRSDDPAALAGAIERLERETELRARLASGARARVESRYSLVRMLAAYDRVYDRVLAEARP